MSSFLSWPFGKGKSGFSSKDQKSKKEEEEEEEFGVTQQLQDCVKGFTVNTFKDYPPQDDQKIDGSASNVSKDLTEWQERHAMLMLSKVKELSQLRYVLCPRHLKERQFWEIYFLLVETYVSRYEIRAITKAKLRMLELQIRKSIDKGAIEVEMADTKHVSGSFISGQCDSELFVDGARGDDKGEAPESKEFASLEEEPDLPLFEDFQSEQ